MNSNRPNTPKSTSSTSASPPVDDGTSKDADRRIESPHKRRTPMRNHDGSAMRDYRSNVVYRSQFLATHPLKSDCKERVGYAGKKFTYVSGDGVIRTMNTIFGHGGWSSQILEKTNVLSEKDDRGRWNVGYLCTVRVTLIKGDGGDDNNGINGPCAFHEDCGSGEGIDNNKVKAHEKAMKSAVTDAMKRAARHFGERLGNALYVKGAGIRTAPRTNGDALLELERRDMANLFGDQAALRANCSGGGDGSSDDGRGVMAVARASTATSSVSVGTNDFGAMSNHVMQQKENWPQNRGEVGQPSMPAKVTGGAASNSYPAAGLHQHQNLQQLGQQSKNQQQQSASSKVVPSPIASSAIQRGSNVTYQNNASGARNGNPSAGSCNASNVYQHPQPQLASGDTDNATVTNAPQPHSNPMAPPPRHTYNPFGSDRYDHRGNPGAKRGPSENRAAASAATSNTYNCPDNSTRQKVNPYSSGNGGSSGVNGRMSV